MTETRQMEWQHLTTDRQMPTGSVNNVEKWLNQDVSDQELGAKAIIYRSQHLKTKTQVLSNKIYQFR